MIAYFRDNFNALKSFDAENLDKMLNSALVQIQVKWEWKITEVLLFCFVPSKIWIKRSCKAFPHNILHQIKFILWFFRLKTCKEDIYLQKEKPFYKENSFKPYFATFEKSDHRRMIFIAQFKFCDKSKEYLALNQS